MKNKKRQEEYKEHLRMKMRVRDEEKKKKRIDNK